MCYVCDHIKEEPEMWQVMYTLCYMKDYSTPRLIAPADYCPKCGEKLAYKYGEVYIAKPTKETKTKRTGWFNRLHIPD